MTVPGGLLPALVHGLVDVTLVSIVLGTVALAAARIPGLDAGTRSRWWSAVAIVPLLAFAAALLQPVALRDGAARAVPPAIAGVVLADPFDAIRGGGTYAQRTQDAAAPGAAATAAATPRSAPFPWLPLALGLWLVVALVRLARVVLSVARAHRIGATAVRAELVAVAHDAASARVALCVHAALDTPVAIGLTQRAVVLPARLAGDLSPAELRAVVLHEIAHLRRRDDWAYLFERIAGAVLWFDPVVHLAVRLSATWRELACDASAAHAAGARTCAAALWRSASILCGADANRATLALLSGGMLVERVEALLRPAVTSARRTAAATVALALLASAATTLAIVRAPAYASPATGLSWTGSMHTRRASFAFVKLRDGRVLVAGGMIANHNFTNAAELYDPARGVFEPTGSLLDGRVGLTGTLLDDGRVLVAGGWTSHGVTSSAELYDPTTARFTALRPMHSPRAGHTATRLRDGTVLLTGGAVANNVPTPSAELYDPRRGAFVEIAPMPQSRAAHTATLLPDGHVLVTGGLDESDASLRATLVYDPATRAFAPGPQMREPRSKHSATLLADGSVLIAGGGSNNRWSSRLDDTERYEPKTNRFVAAGTMRVKRFKIGESVVRLANGDVLVAGGGDRAELYDAAHDRFRLIDGSMGNARNLGAALLLDDGSVLIAGGYDSVDPLPTTDTAQRYR